jgi:hypothetical protein
MKTATLLLTLLTTPAFADEWKAPTATAEDYAELDRHWDRMKAKLDRLDKDVVARKPVKTPARAAKQPAVVPRRITILYRDGTVVVIEY